jgi:hypothetical protein
MLAAECRRSVQGVLLLSQVYRDPVPFMSAKAAVETLLDKATPST